jgi:hypothetical protein
MIRRILALCSLLLLLVVTMQTAAACEPIAQDSGIVAQLDDDNKSPAPDLAPELPELFFLPAGHFLPQSASATPAAHVEPTSPTPYLAGLLRPPCPRA